MAVKKRTTFKPPAKATSTYSFAQLEALWIGAGGPSKEAPLAAAIALAESSGNPNAEGHNTNGTIDRGLWQINSVHGALSTTNIAANAKAAVQIYKAKGNTFTDWVTYNTGAAGTILSQQGKVLTPAEIAKLPKEPSVMPGTKEAVEGGLEAVIPGLSGLTGWVAELIKGLAGIAVNGVLLLAGAILVVYGIMVAVRPRESALSLPKMPMPMPVPV